MRDSSETTFLLAVTFSREIVGKKRMFSHSSCGNEGLSFYDRRSRLRMRH
jgi:hypothetical protein